MELKLRSLRSAGELQLVSLRQDILKLILQVLGKPQA